MAFSASARGSGEQFERLSKRHAEVVGFATLNDLVEAVGQRLENVTYHAVAALSEYRRQDYSGIYARARRVPGLDLRVHGCRLRGGDVFDDLARSGFVSNSSRMSPIRSNASALVGQRSNVMHDPSPSCRSTQNGKRPSARKTTTYAVIAECGGASRSRQENRPGPGNVTDHATAALGVTYDNCLTG